MHTRSFHGNDLRERAFRRLRRAEAENTPALGAGRDSIAAINEQVNRCNVKLVSPSRRVPRKIFVHRVKAGCGIPNIPEPSPYVYS